jgi:hypothetical protein
MIMPRLLYFRTGLGYGSISFPIKRRLLAELFFCEKQYYRYFANYGTPVQSAHNTSLVYQFFCFTEYIHYVLIYFSACINMIQ